MTTATVHRFVVITRAAGVTFVPDYPRNLIDLVERLGVEDAIDCELVRDLDNAQDLNAVRVEIEGRPVGHLAAYLAAEIAPDIDAGGVWRAQALLVAVHPEHRKRPGLILRLWREG